MHNYKARASAAKEDANYDDQDNEDERENTEIIHGNVYDAGPRRYVAPGRFQAYRPPMKYAYESARTLPDTEYSVTAIDTDAALSGTAMAILHNGSYDTDSNISAPPHTDHNNEDESGFPVYTGSGISPTVSVTNIQADHGYNDDKHADIEETIVIHAHQNTTVMNANNNHNNANAMRSEIVEKSGGGNTTPITPSAQQGFMFAATKEEEFHNVQMNALKTELQSKDKALNTTQHELDDRVHDISILKSKTEIYSQTISNLKQVNLEYRKSVQNMETSMEQTQQEYQHKLKNQEHELQSLRIQITERGHDDSDHNENQNGMTLNNALNLNPRSSSLMYANTNVSSSSLSLMTATERYINPANNEYIPGAFLEHYCKSIAFRNQALLNMMNETGIIEEFVIIIANVICDSDSDSLHTKHHKLTKQEMSAIEYLFKQWGMTLNSIRKCCNMKKNRITADSIADDGYDAQKDCLYRTYLQEVIAEKVEEYNIDWSELNRGGGGGVFKIDAQNPTRKLSRLLVAFCLICMSANTGDGNESGSGLLFNKDAVRSLGCDENTVLKIQKCVALEIDLWRTYDKCFR